jgi:hypothetical protein
VKDKRMWELLVGDPKNPKVLKVREAMRHLYFRKPINFDDWMDVTIIVDEWVKEYEQLERIGEREECEDEPRIDHHQDIIDDSRYKAGDVYVDSLNKSFARTAPRSYSITENKYYDEISRGE